ncbi:GvpL/GvpF family gas vesicle protein [Streptomyces lonarensis]|uniref:Gas vesicle protein n=1 Tax=Streptomyces lonarensis TaxID=700599 RepID=A0A7X6HX49_9ACTN|nr:GvpL/GvpF family gas vesicle protein [Streptomyces lonarensis]NJQ04166.1 gas vesicle protein [Streptomyces lonarensis]
MSVAASHPLDDTTEFATCAFAVRAAGSEPGPLPSGLRGHPGGGRPRTLTVGDLSVVVQSVPAAAFAGDALADRLQDPAELERCVRAHHGVITAAALSGAVVPLPLATLYLDDDRAMAAVHDRREQLSRLLAELSGRAEWGIKVTSVAGPRPSETTPATGSAEMQPVDGHAYLDRLRGRRQAREERQEAELRAAERVLAVVRRAAVAARRLRPQELPPSGGVRQLLNAALLVDHAAEARLRSAVHVLALDRGIAERATVELTGPWVPYSFARLDEEVPDGVR